MNQGALHFDALLSVNNFDQGINKIKAGIREASGVAQRETQKMDSYFKNLSTAIGGYFTAQSLFNFTKELIKVRGEFQKTEIAFTTMLGSGTKAAVLMSQMVDLAAKTPFGLEEVSAGAKQLLAFQVPANQVVDVLTRMGNIAAGLGVPLSRINLVYGQVRAKGRLMGDDLRQFTEAGIPMIAELAKKFKTTESAITEMVSAGKIGFKDVQDVLFNLTNEGGMFFNLMEKQSASLSGKVANLGDAWDQMLNKIGEANEGLLYDSIEGLVYLVEHYEEVIKVIKVLITTYGAYRAALIVTNTLQAGVAAPAVIQGLRNLIALLRGATVAQTALNAASIANPYILLATAIAGIVAIIITYRKEIDNLLHDYSELAEQIKYNDQVQEKYSSTFSKGIVDNREKIVSLIAVINSENSKLEDRERAYERLIKIDESFRGALDEQYKATRRLGTAFDYVVEKMQRFALVQAEMSVKTEYLRQNAEDEFNLSIAKVKYDEASRVIKKQAELLNQGKISVDEYAKAVKPYQDVAKSLQKSQQAVKESRKDVDYVNKAEREKLETLRKQETILNAQIQGGKIQGKLINEQQKNILRRNLKDVQDEIKLRLGETFEESINDEVPKDVLGWKQRLEEQIKELDEAIDKAPTKALAAKLAAKKAILVKELNSINPEKGSKKQLAEFLPIGSIRQFERELQLLNDAIDLAVNNQVKLRKLDKFGNDKDKNGNPYLTGEILSLEEAYTKREELESRISSLQYKNFQERVEEAERQWNNYYKMAEFYGKESADAQYQELFKGSQNYLQYLENEKEALENIAKTGILTNQQKKDIVFLTEKINNLNGNETPLENFKRDIDNALKVIPSLVDQLRELENAEDQAFQREGGNTNLFLEEKKYIAERKKEVLQNQQDLYNNFLTEQITFEERQTEIEQKYNDIRKKIGENDALSQSERLRLLNAAGKQEAKEYRDAFMSVFEKTDLFEKAFGNIDALTKKEVSQLLPQLEKKMQEFIDLGAPTAEIETFRKKIEDLRSLTTGNSPFKSLINSFKELRKRIREGTATQEDFNRLNQHVQETKFYTDLAVDSAKELADALGIDGKGGPFEKFAKDLTQTLEGLVNALVGYFTGNIQQMVGGIAQMVVGIVKMLSTAGDGKKEKSIRSWQRAVDDLRYSYEELQKVIEKTAGESALKMQRELIANLKDQQRLLIEMRNKEAQKKKADQDKIDGYNQQIKDINSQISEIVENFKNSILTTDFRDLSQKIADALIDAFGKGEDAAKAFDKVVDDVMRNAVANALRIKILEPAVQQMVDKLYSSMGFGNNDISSLQSEIGNLEKKIKEAEEKMKMASVFDKYILQQQISSYKQAIDKLKQQIAESNISGSFDGLTETEREAIKSMGETAMQQYMDALKEYEDLFGSAAGNAQGLKGDIKGITEKTAGALEAQFNAVRINVVEILKIHQFNQNLFKNQLVTLSQIEVNTRNLVQMRKDLAELNAKTKNQLAGIP